MLGEVIHCLLSSIIIKNIFKWNPFKYQN